jgi:hypothetical protein
LVHGWSPHQPRQRLRAAASALTIVSTSCGVRGEQDTRAAFMREIGERIRAPIASGLSPRNEHQGLGSCPRCKADVVGGREAYGCTRKLKAADDG